MQSATADEFLTVGQLAEKLHYSEDRVRQLARSGQLPAIKRGRSWLFDFEKVKSDFLIMKEQTKQETTGDFENDEANFIE